MQLGSSEGWEQRDSRGEWKPDPLPTPGPVFRRPWKPLVVAKYLFAPEGLLWPINLIYALLAIVVWRWFTPSLDSFVSFSFLVYLQVYFRNVVLLIVIAGGLHLRLYMARAQGTKFKYNDKWLSSGRKFLFNNQTADNVFWNLTSGAAIWATWESFSMWLFVTNRIPYLRFADHPVYFVVLMVMVIFLRTAHFYWTHRFIHWKPLYKLCHFLHHKNINIGPWSGLSMHPIEHLLYFSGAIFHWVIPSHPVHLIYHLLHAGVSPALGHAGFHKLLITDDDGLQADHYFHYLHHKYFTCNFGHESIPFDKWFGSFHDGTEASLVALRRNRPTKSQPNLAEGADE